MRNTFTLLFIQVAFGTEREHSFFDPQQLDRYMYQADSLLRGWTRSGM
jgi:hypothetical protein